MEIAIDLRILRIRLKGTGVMRLTRNILDVEG